MKYRPLIIASLAMLTVTFGAGWLTARPRPPASPQQSEAAITPALEVTSAPAADKLLQGSAASSSPIDVSGQVSVTQNGFARNRATGIWSANLNVTNIGGSAISGPIEVVLTNLSPNVTLVSSTTSCGQDPVVVLTSGALLPKASAMAAIQFANPTNGLINYDPITYSGSLSCLTWSAPQLGTTLFPGASSTVNVSFRSNANLGAVTIAATASLGGTVSVNPTGFASVTANQDYQVTLHLAAPIAFQRASFGGTIQVRSVAQPSSIYPPTLPVAIHTDFLVLSNPTLGFAIDYPLGLVVTKPDPQTILLSAPVTNSGDALPGISVVKRPNPQGVDILSFYADLLAQAGGTYSTGSAAGLMYYRFDPFISEAGSVVVVFIRQGYFWEFQGPTNTALNLVLPSLSFQ